MDHHKEREAHWNGIYAQRSPEEVSWYQADPRTSLALIAACNIAKNAAIVDVGGGASRLVDALLDLGMTNLTVLDIATAALDAARARLGAQAGAVHWVVSDVLEAKLAPQDLWHDRAAFHFLTDPAERLRYRSLLLDTVPPKGHVIIATFAADGPERCSGLPVQRYSTDSLCEEFGDGLSLVQAVTEDHGTPGGEQQRFLFGRFVRV